MNYTWIAGRLLLPAFIVAATITMMGSMRPGSKPTIGATTQESALTGNQVGTQDSSKRWNIPESEIGKVGSQDGSNSWDAPKGEIGKAEDLVKDWKNPDFVLFISGRQHGYIEPCGCITLERQKGGLMRRDAVKKILEARGWPLVAIDAGNQVRRTGHQPEIKLKRTYEALWQKMKYDVIGVGPDDLNLPQISIAQMMINSKQDADPANGILEKNPFTCANVQILGDQIKPFQIIQQNGKRIGVTMILGDEHLAKLKGKGVDVKAADAALPPIVAAMDRAGCDKKVLIAFTSLDECRKFGQKYPFDVLVTAGGAGDPTLHPEIIRGPRHVTAMVQVGVKGMYVGLIGFFSNSKEPMKYERVELDHRFEDSKDIKKVFKAYQDELKDRWTAGTLDDIRPRKHPSGHTFVGSDACANCHDEEFEIWEDGVDGNGGPHAEATDDLEENPNDNRVWVRRDFDPECMSCHAVGWNPQSYFPYQSGLTDIKRDVHLRGNGCENCHGPGSAHVEMEERVGKKLPFKEARRKELLAEVRVTIAESKANACKECHDLDNSPDFLKEGGFDEYWPKIKHGGND